MHSAFDGFSASGSATMQTVSAIATWTTVATTRSPVSPAPSITGITSAAELDASNTA